MAGQDIYTMTPGSEVADTLQEILTRRKAEARQSMLDQINQRNINSEIAARDENTRSMADYRKAQEDKMAEDAYQTAVKGLKRGTPMSSIDPELAGKIRAHGRAGQYHIPGASVGTSTSFGPDAGQAGTITEGAQQQAAPKDVEAYLGTSAEEDDETRQQKLNAIIGSPDFQKLPPLQQWMALRDALPKGEAPPAPNMWSQDDEVPALIFDQPSGKVTAALGPDGKPIMVPKGQRILNRGYAPQPNASNAAQMMQFPDPQHPGQILSYWLHPGEMPSQKNQIAMPTPGAPAGTPPTPVSSSTGAFRGNVPSAVYNPSGGGAGATKIAPGLLMDARKVVGNRSAQGQAQLHAAVENIITSYRTTPNVRATVRAVLSDPNLPAGITPDQIMGRMGGMPEAEKADIQDLISNLLPLIR